MQLILGTVQFGLNYGITNIKGKPTTLESHKIIKYALQNNINIFDTARAYGNSEYILGLINQNQDLKIITKLCPLVDQTKNNIIFKIDESIKESIRNLNIYKIDTLLLHRFEQYNNKIIWNYLIENKFINKLGASLYYVEEAIQALKDDNIKHIQIPINILDSQWFSEEFLNLVKKRKDVTIHCRSILLQGILVSTPDKWPKLDNVNPLDYVEKLEGFVEKFNFNSRTELCFSYIKSIKWLDGLIIGVDNLDQLKNNINYFKIRDMTEEEFLIVRKTFNKVPRNLLNPSLWLKRI